MQDHVFTLRVTTQLPQLTVEFRTFEKSMQCQKCCKCQGECNVCKPQLISLKLFKTHNALSNLYSCRTCADKSNFKVLSLFCDRVWFCRELLAKHPCKGCRANKQIQWTNRHLAQSLYLQNSNGCLLTLKKKGGKVHILTSCNYERIPWLSQITVFLSFT